MHLKNRDKLTVILLLAPSLIGFGIFFLIPFLGGFYYSLVDSPIGGKFVWLTNYGKLLSNPIFLRAAGNTFILTGVCVPLIMALSLGIALLLNRSIYIKNILRSSFVMPMVVPVASVVLVWQVLFDTHGSLNSLLVLWKMHPVDWMNTGWARFVVLIVYLWKNTGYNMVLFLAGLQNIPVEYYESARIDGAGALRQFSRITLIYLTPTSFFVFVISIINSFKMFRETYLIAGAYPHDSIYILQHYMNNTFMSLDYQKLTTAAILMAAVIYLLVLGLFMAERKISKLLG